VLPAQDGPYEADISSDFALHETPILVLNAFSNLFEEAAG